MGIKRIGRPPMYKIHQHDKHTLAIINTYVGFRGALDAVKGNLNYLWKCCECYPRRSYKGYRWSKEFIDS